MKLIIRLAILGQTHEIDESGIFSEADGNNWGGCFKGYEEKKPTQRNIKTNS
jgi:hypothetical protein